MSEREILFRGKRIDNGEWVEGYWFGIWGKRYICWETTNGVRVPNMVEVIPETRGEYTGLTDRNGTRIFEGDIIKDDIGCMEVIFDAGAFAAYSNLGIFLERHKLLIDILTDEELEVIGNIFDNPELLKGE